MWPAAACCSASSLTFFSSASESRLTSIKTLHGRVYRIGRAGVRAEVTGGGGAGGAGGGGAEVKVELRTCRNCKQVFNTRENHPRACRFHTAHYGGETKRKFESVHTGGTMETVGGGQIVAYWHCCGAADAFDPGCEAAPHMSYDD